MRIFAIELDNGIKGIHKRKEYIESLIKLIPDPDLIVLPELSLCSYMASNRIWKYADDKGKDAHEWASEIARRYDTYIGIGYLAGEDGDYYNRYLIAGPEGVCGEVTKSEGESAVFKRGDFASVIETPFGRVGVGICYDSRRKHFYNNVRNEELSLILFPHASPADPKKPNTERNENDTRCMLYREGFGVPVVYVNCTGDLEYMPGKMGRMMADHGFRMNGLSRIYAPGARIIDTGNNLIKGADVDIRPGKLAKEIRFHGDDILPGNWLFKTFILKKDTEDGIIMYERDRIAINTDDNLKK